MRRSGTDEMLLDRWIDGLADGLAESDHAHDDLLELMDVALLVRQYGGTEEEAAKPVGLQQRRSYGRLARVAAVVVLLAGLAIAVVISRSSTGSLSPTGGGNRCLGPVRAVEADGAHLPSWALVNVLNDTRDGGDPCPSAPVRWVRTTLGQLGLGGDKTAVAVEMRGNFYSNPYTHVGLKHTLWIVGDSAFEMQALPPGTSLSKLGKVHELLLRPAPTTPDLVPPKPYPLVVATLGRGIGMTAVTQVRWTELTLPALRRLAPDVRWAPAKFQGDGYHAWLFRLVGSFQRSGHKRPARYAFDVEIHGSSDSAEYGPTSLDDGAVQFGIPAGWQPIAALLASPRVHAWWMNPERTPTALPTWVMGDLRMNGGSHHPAMRAQWVVTTAQAFDRLLPYETVFPVSMPAPTPVFVVDVTYSNHEGLSGVEVFTQSPTTDIVYVARGITSPWSSLPLSRLGRVHPLTQRSG